MSDERLLQSIGMTEAEADARGKSYEEDTWDEKTLCKPRRGRPSLSSEEVRPYTVRFPVSLMSFVDERALAHGWTRSEELRSIVLQAKGQHVA